jgi:uncharacterized protein (DUF1015 family)
VRLIRPFRAWRPAVARAAEVLAPPYDVMSTAEARAMAHGRLSNFLHVSRAEIDLPESADPHGPEVYELAHANFTALIRDAVLRRDPTDGFYVYRLAAGAQVQTGLVVAASLQAYRDQRIKRHELTRPDKQADRARHIARLGAQTGPAMLAYPDAPRIDRLIAECSAGRPETEVTGADGVVHSIWPIFEPDRLEALQREFDALPTLYIADGHHRTAAAEHVANERRSRQTDPVRWDGFLAVAFPHHAMRILDYNRLVGDLNGLTESAFLAALGEHFAVSECDAPARPRGTREFGLYLPGRWFRLRAHAAACARPYAAAGLDTATGLDPAEGLDVSLLSRVVLGPILGIRDLRRDSRIEFVGGRRSLAEIEERVQGGMAAAFVVHPCAMTDLMAIADQGGIMPPKSTWFEPKLADGLVSLALDSDLG